MRALPIFGTGPVSGQAGDSSSPMGRTARMAGSFYLIFIILLPIATTIRSQLVISGDAAATVHNIMANDLLYRISYMTELVSALFFLLAAWALFALLRTVNKNLALLLLLLNLCGVVIECTSVLDLSSVTSILGGDYATAFTVDQLQAQAVLHIGMYDDGFKIAQLFFGAWLLPLGLLVYRSGFLPRLLGVLLLIDFIGVLVCFLQYFLLPEATVICYPCWAAGFLAEVSLTLWLLIKGVKENKPVANGGI